MAKQVDRKYMQKYAKTAVGKARLSIEDIRGLTKGMQEQGPMGSGFGQISSNAYKINMSPYQALGGQMANAGQAFGNQQLVGGPYNPLDQGSYNAQQQAMQQLLGRASQDSPSAAQAQFQQGLDQAMKAQASQAASARGINPALAARLAQSGAEGVMTGAAAQAAQLRAQEAQTQRAQQMAELQGAAGIGAGIQGQALGQQLGFAGAQTQQAQTAAGIQAAGGALGMQAAGMQAAARQAEEQARQQYYNRILGQYGSLAGLGGQQSQAQWGAAPSGIGADLAKAGIGGLASGLGEAGASWISKPGSDTRLKKNIDEEQGEEDLQEFLDALKPAKYEYKDKADGEGPQYSVMAQDLEKSDVGKVMVEKRPDGMRQVNYAKGLAAMLSAQAFINKRLKKLEKKAA